MYLIKKVGNFAYPVKKLEMLGTDQAYGFANPTIPITGKQSKKLPDTTYLAKIIYHPGKGQVIQVLDKIDEGLAMTLYFSFGGVDTANERKNTQKILEILAEYNAKAHKNVLKDFISFGFKSNARNQ